MHKAWDRSCRAVGQWMAGNECYQQCLGAVHCTLAGLLWCVVLSAWIRRYVTTSPT